MRPLYLDATRVRGKGGTCRSRSARATAIMEFDHSTHLTENLASMLTNARLFYGGMAGIAVTIAGIACAAYGQNGLKRRAAPPKFDPQEVEQVFFSDARKAL